MSKEKQQTAVEWLIQELGEYFPHEIGGIEMMVSKAKEMEKFQIYEAFIRDLDGVYECRSCFEYYEEKYGK